MHKFTARMSVLCAVALLIFAPAFARVSLAQDTMTHTCNSTLITLLFIAENDYGYHSMSMDTSTFEKGEYAPLFQSMMAQQSMMTPTEEPMSMTEEPMSMTETDMMMLQPGAVAGEDPACTALRADLESFFYDHFSQNMDTGM